MAVPPEFGEYSLSSSTQGGGGGDEGGLETTRRRLGGMAGRKKHVGAVCDCGAVSTATWYAGVQEGTSGAMDGRVAPCGRRQMATTRDGHQKWHKRNTSSWTCACFV